MTTNGRPPDGTARRGPRKGMGAAARMGLVLFATLLVLGVVGAGVAVAGYVSLSRNLPAPTMLEEIQLPEQSVIWDRTHEVELATFGEFNRTVVTFDEIPPVLVDATTAVEDASFWENAGFDPIGIVAAGVDAVRGRPRGASTITQQLVRQRLLTNDGEAQTQVTANRKLKEIIQSIRVTQAFPGRDGKQRIIAAYLNQNFYGNESYGVAAAAESYFGKELSELTLAEAAIIAALPQSPGTYDLVQNAVEECLEPGEEDAEGEPTCAKAQLVVPEDTRIVQRRNAVLDLMARGRTPLTGDELTSADFEAAKAEKVVLASQVKPAWKASHFVWQVRRELTQRLCGVDTETCPVLERGGLDITSTLDVRLQEIAEKWVKAATIVPHAKNPAARAKALGLEYEAWMKNLRTKDLRNGALVAMDYQTGELVAYVGSANARATKATKKFQPRFDVIADGWRQPGSTFKPFVYASGIQERAITNASMFMDVVTDFGGGWTPTDADNQERGPVRSRNALQFSLNIPAIKALAVIGNDTVQRDAEAMGLQFREGTEGLAFALGTAEVRPLDLIRGYGTLGDAGKLADQTSLISVTTSGGETLIDVEGRPEPEQVMDPGAAFIVTNTLAGNTNPSINPFWGRFKITSDGKRRPATLKTGTNNDAKDLNAYGYIGAPSKAEREAGEYALAVGAWNGNSDNSFISTPQAPLFSIDVTTHVWQGFLQEATEGWSINAFRRPDGLEVVAVDPWTGLRATGGDAVEELFLLGTAPGSTVPQGSVCGQAVFGVAGFENQHPEWMRANEGWMRRAERGPGVRGGPENTRTAFFYNNSFNPFGRSWGPLVGGEGCASPSPSASAALDPCDPLYSPDPFASIDPLATPVVCPSPSEAPTEAPTETPPPTAEPTAPPTAAPTPPPTPAPTPPPTPAPTPAPTAPPSAAPPAP